jgi:uncharacterized integral membrane protein
MIDKAAAVSAEASSGLQKSPLLIPQDERGKSVTGASGLQSGESSANGSGETSADRAASVQQVIAATAGETNEVKQAALNAVGGPIPPPTKTAGDIAWIVLVCGLVLLLILALLALTHVIGTGVSDDKVITIFTASLAGLLGLFSRPPGVS